ncbi:TGF-beta receptor interacting domain-containing protein [Aureispira anguillae]|uniref:DUF3480 domain-containing protein n=1 Tax=Aureispira anguillae TaxID=2864201 RepID=A0A915YDH8_9BACT|nr:DUF3480 domain-containing protein [Aureispira anguillae]BDS11102.1 DUF3480 domain-containing protein [Aureispira anguillae]
MGFFKKIFNKFRTNKEATSLPATLELIPGELWVSVAVHELPVTFDNQNKKALSFTTRGLESQGQQELFFVLKTNRTNLDEVPQEPLYFFQQVYKVAQQGHLAKEGSITQFGENDLWGWKGIVYAKAPAHLQGILPKQCLNMVLLSLEEVQAVQEFGYTRILSMLGKQARYYPFPYWTDHYRENLLIQELNKSLLKSLRRMVFPEASVTLINNQHIYLTINYTAQLNLAHETFPSSIPLAFLPSLDSKADACLTWSFQPNAPEAITPPNSQGNTMGGCMLLIIGQQKENKARILEDGFALLLNNDEWKQFWKAIQNKQNYKLQTAKDFLDFSLLWR